MTNEVNYTPIKYACNGATDSFSFQWKIIAASDLIVILEDETTKEQITLIDGVDYMLYQDIVGGYIVTTNKYPQGKNIILSREVSQYQDKTYSSSSGFQAKEIEESFDKLSANVQDLKYTLDRALKVPVGSGKLNVEFPENLINDNTLVWSEEKGAFVNYDVIGEMDSFEQEIEADVDAFKSSVNQTLQQNKENTDADISSFKQSVNSEIAVFKDDVDSKIETFNNYTNEKINEFKDEVNEQIEVVSEAAGKINELEGAVQNAVEAAEVASVAAENASKAADNASKAADNAINALENCANVGLDNLSKEGADKLNASKMYLTGSVSTDEQGYNQLEDMYHSTFDLSKFEVVGSPNITSDGVASGFGGKNIVAINSDLIKNKPFHIKLLWHSGSTISQSNNMWQQNCFISLNYGVNGFCVGQRKGRLQLSYALDSNGQEIISNGLYGRENVFTTDTDYFIDFIFTGTEYKFYVNKELIYSFSSILYPNAINGITLGVYGRNGHEITGSIDLKQFSITVDGKEVFNGNKTGLDVIKSDDYTVVGSPTITSDGVASGFGVSDYLNISDVITNNKTWEIKCKFNTNDFSATQSVFGFSNSYWSNTCSINTNKNIQFYLAVGSNSTVVKNLGSNKCYISEGVDNYLYVKFDGNKYEIGISQDGINYNTDSYISSEALYIHSSSESRYIQIGKYGGQPNTPFLGSIDLNAFKIYVDDELVYQPCLKIPYNVSKTGSKIVPAYARDRVQDVYEQYGQAEYYTIDEENKNFTLPMGEIYGMIETAKSNISSRAIGEILRVTATDDYVPDGTLYIGAIQDRASSEFQQLWDNWLVKRLLPTCSYSEYELEVTMTGACYKWAVDTENGTFRTPFVPDRIIHNVKDKALVEYNMDTTNSQMFRYPVVDSSGKLNAIVGGAMSSDNTVGWGPYSTSSIADAKFGAAYFNGTGIKTIDGVGISGFWVPMNVDPNGTMQTDLASSVITSTIKHFVVISNGSINKSQRDWSKFESGLNSKVNTDLSNITQSGKANAVSWGMPDYSRQIEITLVSNGTTTYTAPSDGFLWGKQISGTTDMPITINNNKVFGHKASSGTVSNPFYFQVAKGDVVVISNAATSSPNNYAYFAPMKGVN